MNEKFSKLGFYPADILLPNKDVDMEKWAVVACDQFTSEPEYWERVEKTVGDAPSTLRLILPEANLKAPNVDEFIADINASMSKYLEEGIFETLKDSLIYIERGQSDGKIRHGLIGMVDLDQYDFTPGSGALIRATEGTVLDRIPPRARVRRNAPIELPHVMLLIDDPDKTVIEPLTAAAGTMEKLYDFDLMQNGGHITGYKLSDKQIDAVAASLEGLTTDDAITAAHTVLASQFLNEAFAKDAGMREEQMGLGHAFEMDPAVEDTFLYELAQAQMAREIFPNAPLKYMPPTKFMTGNIFRGHIQDALFNMVTILTNQRLCLLGMMTEAIHTPFMSDRALSIENAQYIFRTMKDLGDELTYKEGGIIRTRANEVLTKATDLLSEIEKLGLFTTIEKGIFADVKRPKDGGKGLAGVVIKDDKYFNPFIEVMKGKVGA